jgi:hypothetical protein
MAEQEPYKAEPTIATAKSGAVQKRKAAALNVLAGVTTLLIGALVYVFDRPVDLVPPIFSNVNASIAGPTVFGVFGNNLPSLTHAFSFSVFTAVYLGINRASVLFSCISWLVIGTLLEFGQRDASATISLEETLSPITWELLPPVLGDYKLAGTFDWLDILASTIGALCAYVFLLRTHAVYGGMSRFDKNTETQI